MTRRAKVLYGLLFVAVLPLGLAAFSARVAIPMAIARYPVTGAVTAGAGLVVMLWGMWDIWRRGHGLPMNACPPKQLVTAGLYAVVPQPIYAGFTAACAGVSGYFGSATGLLLTTPLVALSAGALVLGHERPYLLKTFGRMPRPVFGSAQLLGPVIRGLRLNHAAARVLGWTESLANSWTAWRLGSARVINHACFAGLAGGVGVFLAVLLAGREQLAAAAVLGLAGIAGAAVVGQLMVGSSRGLSRPFGYFGGLLGMLVAGLVMLPFDAAMGRVLAAFAFAGPWIQALGRLRCLVQGCCHGAPVAAADPGIVITNQHSRVALAGLQGTRIYPTQLYSILGNLAIAAVLVGLWSWRARLTLVGGLYLTLAGLVRFIEEGYRGEPLTKVIAGLHSYQWFAVGMVLTGLLVMMLPAPAAPRINVANLVPALGMGAVFFVVCGCALGVDFPDSRRRFSRLSG